MLNLIRELEVGLAGSSLAKEQSGGFFPFHEKENVESTLSISVIGASGDLAKKKIFPALFALYYEGFLPKVIVLFCTLISHIIQCHKS